MKNKNLIGEKITKDEFLTFFSRFWSSHIHKKITIKDELGIKYNENKKASVIWKIYYLDEHNNEVLLTKNDLSLALQLYSYIEGYRMENYQIIGGVRLAENNPKYDKDIPVIEGIFIYYNGLINSEQENINEQEKNSKR